MQHQASVNPAQQLQPQAFFHGPVLLGLGRLFLMIVFIIIRLLSIKINLLCANYVHEVVALQHFAVLTTTHLVSSCTYDSWCSLTHINFGATHRITTDFSDLATSKHLSTRNCWWFMVVQTYPLFPLDFFTLHAPTHTFSIDNISSAPHISMNLLLTRRLYLLSFSLIRGKMSSKCYYQAGCIGSLRNISATLDVITCNHNTLCLVCPPSSLHDR